jgi:hypothetical protein
MKTFTAWLMEQKDRQDEVGKFAQFIEKTKVKPQRDYPGPWMQALDGNAKDKDLEGFYAAVAEYRATEASLTCPFLCGKCIHEGCQLWSVRDNVCGFIKLITAGISGMEAEQKPAKGLVARMKAWVLK